MPTKRIVEGLERAVMEERLKLIETRLHLAESILGDLEHALLTLGDEPWAVALLCELDRQRFNREAFSNKQTEPSND